MHLDPVSTSILPIPCRREFKSCAKNSTRSYGRLPTIGCAEWVKGRNFRKRIRPFSTSASPPNRNVQRRCCQVRTGRLQPVASRSVRTGRVSVADDDLPEPNRRRIRWRPSCAHRAAAALADSGTRYHTLARRFADLTHARCSTRGRAWHVSRDLSSRRGHGHARPAIHPWDHLPRRAVIVRETGT